MNSNPISNTSNASTDLRAFIRTYTKQWKWFVLCVLVALICAFLYIRYATEEYEVRAKIQFLDVAGDASGLNVLGDLGLAGGGTNKIEDEIELIRSRSNLIESIKDLGLHTKILALGNIKNSELYHNRPFNINYFAPDSVLFNTSYEFFIELSTETTIGFGESKDSPLQVYSFGKNIATPIGDIVITPNLENFKKYLGQNYKVTITPVATLAEIYQEVISIAPAGDNTNIVNIRMNVAVPQKGMDLINSLIETYNENVVLDKKIIADRTSDFINDRIGKIASSLSSVDESAQEFKTGRGITDIASEANINLNIGAANRQDLENASVQLDIASSMKDIVESQEGFEVLPSNIGLSDASIANTTARYNELVLERKRLLKSSNEKNPIIVNLDQQLASLKRSMETSLNSVTNNLALTVNNLSSQQSRINSRIYSVPQNERALRDITRQQQTTEALYLYLLQKREESQIAYASAKPKSKTIDSAYSTKDPVSPNIPVIFFTSFVLGLIVPFSVIYVHSILDNKIHNKIELERLVTNVPVLAELPKLSKKDNTFIVKDDRSVLAESLRILRTNLDYLIKTKRSGGTKGNVIFVTSSVPGEGKTFLSSNLAMILSSTNKKVILIGADIRNPKLYSFFTGKNVDKLGVTAGQKGTIGLTDFLYDQKLEPRDIISSMLVHKNTIDVIYSGKIPPNPAELIMSERLSGLFREMSEKYDYVIVDTAPLMVVTDTLLISEHADQILYVTRAGVTEKKVLDFPLKLRKEGKLKGLSFIVNDVKDANLGYGGGYGYGYGRHSRKWWRFN